MTLAILNALEKRYFERATQGFTDYRKSIHPSTRNCQLCVHFVDADQLDENPYGETGHLCTQGFTGYEADQLDDQITDRYECNHFETKH